MVVIHPAITMSLGICSILLVYVICEAYIGKWISQGIVGCITLWVVNCVVPSYMVISFNIWTILVACLIGIPGVVFLYVWRLIDRFLL